MSFKETHVTSESAMSILADAGFQIHRSLLTPCRSAHSVLLCSSMVLTGLFPVSPGASTSTRAHTCSSAMCVAVTFLLSSESYTEHELQKC